MRILTRNKWTYCKLLKYLKICCILRTDYRSLSTIKKPRFRRLRKKQCVARNNVRQNKNRLKIQIMTSHLCRQSRREFLLFKMMVKILELWRSHLVRIITILNRRINYRRLHAIKIKKSPRSSLLLFLLLWKKPRLIMSPKELVNNHSTWLSLRISLNPLSLRRRFTRSLIKLEIHPSLISHRRTRVTSSLFSRYLDVSSPIATQTLICTKIKTLLYKPSIKSLYHIIREVQAAVD